MSKVSVEQRLTVLAKLGEHIDWDSLTTELVQIGVTEAKRAGAEATSFIRNGFRVQISDFFCETDELTIQIPALARPTLEQLQKKYFRISEENGIEHDISPIEAVTLKLGTVLHPDEGYVSSAMYERRLSPKLSICLGYQQAIWLVEHQGKLPEFMALLGEEVRYIDFPGLVVIGADGERNFPCLNLDGVRWSLNWDGFVSGLTWAGRVAVASK